MLAQTSQTTLASLLKSLREARGLSANALAIQAGVNPQSVRNWEAGKFSPRLPELQSVLDALGATAVQKQQAMELLQRPRGLTQIRHRNPAASATRSGDTYVPVTLGDLLRAMRARRKYTLEEIATKIGVVPRTLSRWERGESAPSVKQLHLACHALGATEDEIAMLSLGATDPGTGEHEGPAFLERLRMLFDAANAYPCPPEKAALLELTYISLALRLQPLSWQDPAARTLLSQVYAQMSQLYYLRFQNEMTRAFSGRALELVEDIPLASDHTVLALLRYANALKDPKAGVAIMERWLPRLVNPGQKAWLLTSQAALLAKQGLRSDADARSQQSITLVEDLDYWSLMTRRLGRAHLLSRWRQHDKAMDLLASLPESDDPTFSVISARIVLAQKDYEGARRRLAVAVRHTEAKTDWWAHIAPYMWGSIEQVQKLLRRYHQY